MQILLSSTQAGPGRKVKQEQEEISRNHVPRLFLGSVQSEHEGMKDLFWHYVAYKKEQNAPLWYEATWENKEGECGGALPPLNIGVQRAVINDLRK